MTTKYLMNFFTRLLLILIFFLSFKSFSQIRVNKWINQPESEKLFSPLIYVDFWATWCAPCISSMPHTQALEQKFGDKILFIYVSNEPDNKILSFMTKRNLHFYSASDTDEFTFKQYKIDHLPTSLILDPAGKELWRGKPGELNDKILKKLIAKYGKKRGKSRRINLVKLDDTGNKNNKFSKGKKYSLKYQKFDFSVPYKYANQDEQITYQGNLKAILTEMLQVEPYQIDIKTQPSYWKIIFKEPIDGTEADVALSFLKSAGYLWKIVEEEKEVYQLKERDTSAWLNWQLYQYTDSPSKGMVMVDDYFLTVDNANPYFLVRALSRETPWIFTYKGNVDKIYDWNIRIDSLDNLLKFLITELDFKVKKKTKKIQVYTIMRSEE